jgi:hypothetical protein
MNQNNALSKRLYEAVDKLEALISDLQQQNKNLKNELQKTRNSLITEKQQVQRLIEEKSQYESISEAESERSNLIQGEIMLNEASSDDVDVSINQLRNTLLKKMYGAN